MALVLDRELLGKPKEFYWVSYIRQRIRKNKNFLCFISGQTGSGKSWSSLSIGELVDPNFSISRVVFDGVSLMDLINSGTLSKGSVIVFEEAGVGLGNRNWQSITNKMLNFLVQTFRHKNFVLIMNSPFMDFVDSATRKLFHAEMTTCGINIKKKTCKLKPQLLQYNSRLKKWYYHRLKVIRAEGAVPIQFWNVPKPSDDLIKAYEQKKTEFTAKLNKRIYDELLQEQNKGQKDKSSLTDIQQDTLSMLQEGLNVPRIAEARGRHPSVIFAALKSLKSKGFAFKSVYDGQKLTHYEVLTPEGE